MRLVAAILSLFNRLWVVDVLREGAGGTAVVLEPGTKLGKGGGGGGALSRLTRDCTESVAARGPTTAF